jgi:hypothetical protein
MTRCDYPMDLRVDYADRRSRGWAVLTILLIKFLALIPHWVCLLGLTIAQLIVAFIAQVVVAFKGQYPPGMFAFNVGVLRWSTRVSGFLYSLTDRYPPFSLQPDDGYPLDIGAERPTASSRVYAAFTVVVQVLALAGAVWFMVWVARNVDWSLTTITVDGESVSTNTNPTVNFGSWSYGGLILRQLAAFPHYVILLVLGIVAFAIWIIVQWIILFTASYPRGMFDLVVGIQRWQVRVTGYALGLIDRYPPFTFDPSLVAPAEGPVQGAAAEGPAAGVSAVPAAPAQWYPDPVGRHQYRYWDGTQWTGHVADDGRTGQDPL